MKVANYPYRELGIDLSRKYRNDLNANFKDVENDFKRIQTQSDKTASRIENLQGRVGTLENDVENLKEDFGNVVEIVSDKAFNQVVDAARLIWLSPVDSFSDISTTYPSPQEGQTVMIRETGKIYRFDGTEWIEIQDIDPTIYNELDKRLSEQLTFQKEEIVESRKNIHSENFQTLGQRLNEIESNSFKNKSGAVISTRTLRIRNTNEFIRVRKVGSVKSNLNPTGLIVANVGFGATMGLPFRFREGKVNVE